METLDAEWILRYITETFEGLDVVEASGDTYIFYDPGGKTPPDRRQPFATLITGDRHEQVSRLDRPGVFRLNLGVSQETYRSLFGPLPAVPGPSGIVDTGHDFSVLDELLPHPVYSYLGWICILNPSAATWETKVRILLQEAYDVAAGKHARRAARREREE